jgi:Tfp pilus assembly major pilin PilA
MDSPSSQSEELYRHAVGERKAGYYVPLFYRFEQGSSRVSWNWPALFVTFFWLLYRRMYGLAFGYLLLWPIVLVVLLGVTTLLLGPAVAGVLYWLLALAAQFVVAPMFANAVYHWHVKRRIERLAAAAPSHEALVQRVIGQAATAGAPVVVGAVVVYSFAIGGILAAIALPAYQDYTIRAQVSEGLALAAPVKASIASAYSASGNWPPAELIADAQATGRYVSRIDVSDGAILIHYGNAANRILAGRTLSLHPIANDDQVEWSCGYAAGANVTQTNVAPKYLPSACRQPAVERL